MRQDLSLGLETCQLAQADWPANLGDPQSVYVPSELGLQVPATYPEFYGGAGD